MPVNTITYFADYFKDIMTIYCQTCHLATAILGMRLSAPFRKREFLTQRLKATKRGLIKPVEVFNCAIIGACHLSQKHKPQKPIADSG
jgi:hypothetical protein